MAAILKKHNGLPCLLIIFIFLLLASSNANSQVCSEFNSGSSQSALNIKLDKDKYFELTYKDIARTKKDDFTISFTPSVKKTLRDASGSSNQILSLIIKYDKSEPGRPPMVPLIRFFVAGSLGTTNLKAESSSSDDCKEVHNFNISVQEAKELFQNSRLDFDLLINVLNQGPANRIGQKFRITICLNCISSIELTPSPSPTPGMVELPPDFPTETPTVIPPTPNIETPPENSTTWIIIDGDGAGIQIHSESDLPTSIEPDFNKTTNADGHIADPDECKGPFKHYHGELNNTADPKPTNCGWGHVIQYNKATENIQFISTVLSLEKRAAVRSEKGDIDGALKDLEDSVKQMEELIRKIKEEAKGRKLDPVTGERSEKAAGFKVKKLRAAIRADKAAINELKAQMKGTERFINYLKRALFYKLEAFEKIVAIEFLEPHP